MCSHYEALRQWENYVKYFHLTPPSPQGKLDLWPGYSGMFIRRPRELESGDDAVPEREGKVGVFGLIPHWAKDMTLAKRTYNARSETAAEKPSFRDAWRWGKHCIIPADTIYEPDWRSGKAIPTRISRTDGAPMGIAGLWSSWKSPTGEEVLSYTMLTINADHHELMKNYHRPEDEKRMVVILPTGVYDDWVKAEPAESMEFMQAYPADRLVAEPQPRKPKELE